MDRHESKISRRQFAKSSAVTTALLAGGLAAPGRAQAAAGTLVVGHVSLRHLNPAIQSGNATGVPGTQIFAGLVQLDDKFQPQPYLAKEWQTSADKRTYTFRLVDGATFHDGKPITSEDVAFSLGIVKQYHPFGGPMFGSVERVDTPDPHTAVIKLAHPHPALLTAMSPVLLPILPKHVFGTGPIQTHPANLAPVGSGPFKLVEYKPDGHVILERYDGYFRKGRPYLDRLIFNIIKDPLANVLAVERGDVQYLPFALVRVRDIVRLQGNQRITITKRGYEAFGATNYLEFNHRKAPLNDLRVRKAIAYAIDRTFIVDKLLAGQTVPLDGPLTRSNPFASTDLTRYDLDLDKSNKLLDEAGHSRKANGIRFGLTLEWIPDANPNSQGPIAQYLKPQLQKIGIDIELRAAPDFPSWAKRISNWEHELTMNGIWNYPDPIIGVHRAYLCSNQKKGVIWSNTEGYCNERVDQILNAAAIESDSTKRKALYAEFQKIVTDELPFAWTNEEPLYTIYDRKLEGIPLSVWGALSPFDEMRWKTT